MKLYLLCAFIFVLLLTICFISVFTVKNITKETEDYIQQVIILYQGEQITEGYRQIKQTEAYWKKHNNSLGMLLYHSEIDEITTELAMLNAYAQMNNTKEICCSCTEILTLLEQIREMEYPYLKNII